MGRIPFRMRRGCANDSAVTDCVLVCVFDLTSSRDPAIDTFFCFMYEFSIQFCALRAVSVSDKHSVSGTSMCNKSKEARMNVEGSKTMPKRTSFETVFGSTKNTAPRFVKVPNAQEKRRRGRTDNSRVGRITCTFLSQQSTKAVHTITSRKQQVWTLWKIATGVVRNPRCSQRLCTRRVTIRTGCAQIHTLTRIFQRCSSDTHTFDALRTLSALLQFEVEL